MADITTLTAAKANDILGMSVTSGSIDESGHLILKRANNQTFDAGDFATVIGDLVTAAVQVEVANRVAGTFFQKNTITGTVSFSEFNSDNLVNAMIVAIVGGDITILKSSLPADAKPGTQFAMRLTQNNLGPHSLTLVGFKKSQGVLSLTQAANAIDILVFLYDGTNWYAGLMGDDFK